MKLVKELIRLPQKLTIPAKTQAIQKALLAVSVAPVTDAVTQQDSVNLGREIRRLENDVEKLRKELTKPLVACQREINKLCFDYSAPLKERREQLEAAVTKFQDAEAERVKLEETARTEELKRLQAPVETDGEDVSMQELVAYRQEQAAEELMRAPTPEPARANGAAVKQVMRYEVTDIHALYAARPDLCNPPTERASVILAVCTPELPVPGLRCWYETQTIIRAL